MISIGPVGLVFEVFFFLSSEHSRDDTLRWLFWPCWQVKGHNWNMCLVVARVGGGGGGTRNRDESFGLRPGSKAGFGDLEKCPVFFGGGMVDAMGCSREKWKGGAPCRPQPPSLALHPFSFSSRFFFPHSPFSPLLFPPLLGRRARIWHLAGPALCHHLAGPRVGNREGQNNKVAVSCLFVHSLASTAPSLEKQAPGFMYPIIIKNLCWGIKQQKVSSTNDYHAEMGVQNIPSFSHSTGIWNSEWASQPVALCPPDRQPIKACQTDRQIK